MIVTLKSDADIVFINTTDDIKKLIEQVDAGDRTRKFLVVNVPNFHPLSNGNKIIDNICRKQRKLDWTILLIHGNYLDTRFAMMADGEVMLKKTVL